MKNEIFENTVKIGDTILIYESHTYYDHSKHYEERYTFMGYSPCGGCPGESCPGYVKLQHQKSGKMRSGSGCYRNQDNIRLKIISNSFLPDELFEV